MTIVLSIFRGVCWYFVLLIGTILFPNGETVRKCNLWIFHLVFDHFKLRQSNRYVLFRICL